MTWTSGEGGGGSWREPYPTLLWRCLRARAGSRDAGVQARRALGSAGLSRGSRSQARVHAQSLRDAPSVPVTEETASLPLRGVRRSRRAEQGRARSPPPPPRHPVGYMRDARARGLASCFAPWHRPRVLLGHAGSSSARAKTPASPRTPLRPRLARGAPAPRRGKARWRPRACSSSSRAASPPARSEWTMQLRATPRERAVQPARSPALRVRCDS